MIVEVRPVVCDYGLFINGDLKLILNSLRNANLIKAIIEKDSKCNKSDYYFREKDYYEFAQNNPDRSDLLYE